MSLFQWLTTGSFNGIYLEQEKEPALSQPFLPFFSAATLQSKPIEHGYDLSHPLSCDQLADIGRRAGIIDEHDGKELASKIRQASKQKISAVCVDAIDDEPYVSSQINPLLHCSSEIVRAANWLASAFDVGERFIAVYKNMSALETKIPSFIDGVEVRRLQGHYPMEIRAFRRFDKATFIAGAASLLHLYRAVTEGRRQTTSFVTVAGNCVSSPRNYEVTIGTTVGQLLDRCGLVLQPSVLVEGSAMRGVRIDDPEHTTIRPNTSSILAFHMDRQEQLYSCIGCGRCIEACPAGLNPRKLYRCVTTSHKQKALSLGITSCIGCASCSYICPSRLDLAHSIIQAKAQLIPEQE